MQCPIWQCSGELSVVELDDWQIPYLVCSDCHAVFMEVTMERNLDD